MSTCTGTVTTALPVGLIDTINVFDPGCSGPPLADTIFAVLTVWSTSDFMSTLVIVGVIPGTEYSIAAIRYGSFELSPRTSPLLHRFERVMVLLLAPSVTLKVVTVREVPAM